VGGFGGVGGFFFWGLFQRKNMCSPSKRGTKGPDEGGEHRISRGTTKCPRSSRTSTNFTKARNSFSISAALGPQGSQKGKSLHTVFWKNRNLEEQVADDEKRVRQHATNRISAYLC